ncbi:30S ribosome-binding factor RbfA [Melioribacteraceae bacterium 4301-Me]|uniref:30S ribosome-binding factor RbfA n=1 Tax=Pyranulibacter aquaticus TaxID=3163344 RepID=UPI00359ADFF5
MTPRRVSRVASLIKEELSLIFLHKIQDPQLGVITITNVKVSADLRYAKVYISVYDKKNRNALLDKVDELKSMIRTELAHRITIRFVPELNFFIDDTNDYVERIEDIFKEIHKNDN